MYQIVGFLECPFCQAAKTLLEMEGISYSFREISSQVGRARFLDESGFTGKDRTFPRIWSGERLVGGYAELEKEVLLSGCTTPENELQSVEWDDDTLGAPESFSP